MVSRYSNPKKTTGYRIQGQSKPFVDDNLQLQLPGFQNDHPLTTEQALVAWHRLAAKAKKKFES